MVAFSRLFRAVISSMRSVTRGVLVFCVAEEEPTSSFFKTALRLLHSFYKKSPKILAAARNHVTTNHSSPATWPLRRPAARADMMRTAACGETTPGGRRTTSSGIGSPLWSNSTRTLPSGCFTLTPRHSRWPFWTSAPDVERWQTRTLITVPPPKRKVRMFIIPPLYLLRHSHTSSAGKTQRPRSVATSGPLVSLPCCRAEADKRAACRHGEPRTQSVLVARGRAG